MATTRKKLLVPSTMARAGLELLAARPDVEAISFPFDLPTKDFHALLADADGVALSITAFGPKEVDAAAQLRVVARHGVGYDVVDVPALTRRRIPLMVTGTANSPSVAEHAMCLMLALAKRDTTFDDLVKQRRWSERLAAPLPVDLFGKTVLIIGFGRIGSRTARMCQAFQMKVSVYDPYVSREMIAAAGCQAEKDLDSALSRADFVTIHCPKTPETTGMLNAARLAKMKPTAFLVNTARGGIIDEAALHAALTKGALSGAGLDVFEREPPAPDNPLLDLPNVLTAPHMAGVTRESLDRMAISVAQNLLSVLDGKPNVDNIINKEVLGHR
jgi:D-3-phosphoglycerate dehydrogenase